MLPVLIACALTGYILGLGAEQLAQGNSTANGAEFAQDNSTAPSTEDINNTWFEYPLISQFLFANAAVWPLLWVFCVIARPCFEKLVRKYTLIRKLTGENIARTKSMTKWFVAADRGASGYEYDPFTTGGKLPTKVSKKATGRFVPNLSRLVLFYGTSSGWTYAYRMALFSIVLACGFMRRREHIVSDKSGFQVFFELVVEQVQDTPWKVFHYFAGKILVDNSVGIITGVAGAIAAAITATATLYSSCRDTTRRLNDLERERSMMPTAPQSAPEPVTKVLSVDGKPRRLKSLPAGVASGIHAGFNSAAADGMRRQKSVSRLDTFTRAKSFAAEGISKLANSRVREATLRDFELIPAAAALPWAGPMSARPLSLAPSAPPA